MILLESSFFRMNSLPFPVKNVPPPKSGALFDAFPPKFEMLISYDLQPEP